MADLFRSGIKAGIKTGTEYASAAVDHAVVRLAMIGGMSHIYDKWSQKKTALRGGVIVQGLLSLASGIDRVTRAFGVLAALLVAAACLISALNALSRYAFDLSSNAFLEIQWQMFAGIFLLGSAHVLRLNEHVRVDLVYGALSARKKLWVDVFGFTVFFFPLCVIMLEMGIPWAWGSFVAGETSANAGGLPVWPVKALLPLGFTLLLMQGIAEFIRRIAALRGVIELDMSYEKPEQ